MNLSSLPTLSYALLKTQPSNTNSLTLVSPSTKKQSIFQSPNISTLYSQTLEIYPETKRNRETDSLACNKKGKSLFGPITKLATELFDTEIGGIVGFRCFREHEIIGDQVVSDNIIRNECDDDCSTDDLQLQASREYMNWELEQSLELL